MVNNLEEHAADVVAKITQAPISKYDLRKKIGFKADTANMISETTKSPARAQFIKRQNKIC